MSLKISKDVYFLNNGQTNEHKGSADFSAYNYFFRLFIFCKGERKIIVFLCIFFLRLISKRLVGYSVLEMVLHVCMD